MLVLSPIQRAFSLHGFVRDVPFGSEIVLENFIENRPYTLGFMCVCFFPLLVLRFIAGPTALVAGRVTASSDCLIGLTKVGFASTRIGCYVFMISIGRFCIYRPVR